MTDEDGDALERRYRTRSLWLDGVPGPLRPRPPLDGDEAADVCIVGGGLTGLWTAYYLKEHAPQLRVVVVEREIAGFGASGRNGGWVSGGLAGDPDVYAREHGHDAVVRAVRETYRTVDEVGRVAAAEAIDCGFVKGGQLVVATTPAQEQRLRALIERRRRFGDGPEDVRLLAAEELRARLRMPEVRVASFSPHGARVDPARLTRGLAEVVERRGVPIYERTAVLRVTPGRVETDRGAVTAAHVLRCTEAYTVQLPGQRRRFLPLYSLMIATEPLPSAVWDEIGWSGRETVSDERHLFFYAQRTTDDRIAIGGRGAPYALGSPIDAGHERNARVRERLRQTVLRHFPAARDAEITHHWGGVLGVPRDWCMAVDYDAATGFGGGGGYSGLGVAATNTTGRTLADLVLRRDGGLVDLPWVGHRARRWEPEPLRFLASRAIVGVMGASDRAEEQLPHTARRMRLIQPFIGGH